MHVYTVRVYDMDGVTTLGNYALISQAKAAAFKHCNGAMTGWTQSLSDGEPYWTAQGKLKTYAIKTTDWRRK